MQSALGRVALRKMPGWIETRRRHAESLTAFFSRLHGLRVAVPSSDYRHAYYKYYVFVRPERLRSGWNRDRILQAIVAEGVPCFVGSCSEIYLEKAFVTRRKPERLPVAQELGETSLMFLVHPTLTDDHITHTCRAVEKVMAEATSRGGLKVEAESTAAIAVAQGI